MHQKAWIKYYLSRLIAIPSAQFNDVARFCFAISQPKYHCRVGVVGKYTQVKDAYISICEALNHAGVQCQSAVEVVYINAETLSTTTELKVWMLFWCQVVLETAHWQVSLKQYVLRENKLPFLGICLGMQLMVIEYARHIAGYPMPIVLKWILKQRRQFLPRWKSGIPKASARLLMC